jgi:CRP-like cAMP-binding protein
MAQRRAPSVTEHSLRHIQILEGVPEEALRELARLCTWRSFQAGSRVISRDDPDRHLYLIVSGRVRVVAHAANGRELAYRDVGIGQCLGEIAAIDGQPRSATVEAIEESVVAVVPSTVFWSCLEQNPRVMRKVMELLARTIRSLTERLFEIGTLGVQNRVHAEILRLARSAGVHDGAATIEPAPKHIEIAARISTNREQVTKELSQMARQGLIAKAGAALVVPDVARLERLVAQVARSR